MPDSALAGWLLRRWHGGHQLAWLKPLSLAYAGISGLRRQAYSRGLLASRHPGVPVVIVGNITTGGTGKTPLVIWLAGRLQRAGWRPGVVLRGHGGSVRTAMLVGAGSDPAEAGDEAVLIAGRTGCPVAVGRRRVDAARLLVEAGCNVVLADDGLQHLALRRDVEIAVIDGSRGLGNGSLIPQGPLREPADRLQRVDAVVINGDDRTGIATTVNAPLRMTLDVDDLHALASGEAVSLARLRAGPVHAIAGIGNPERFFATLRTLGLQPVEHPFADHHAFRADDLIFADNLPIVMTEKDAVKCRPFATDRMYCLKVSVSLAEADAARLLQRVLSGVTGERFHA